QAQLKLTPKQLFEQPTIAALAAVATSVTADIAEDIAGDIPLTPIQSWFFERFPEGENHWNQAVLLKVRDLDIDRLGQALNRLVARHDALRLRFHRQADGWRQTVSAAHAVEIEVAEVTDLAEAGTRLQRRLDIVGGPLLRAGCYTLPDGRQRLLLAIHHLAVDGVSWRVLLEELRQAYAGAELPPASTSWAAWAGRLHAYRPPDELGWWRERLSQATGGKPRDRKPSASRSLTWKLDEAATARLLAAAPRAYRLGVDELLLSALVQAAGHGLLVEVEGHGREDLFDDVDLSRTVGWFTTSYPVWLPDGSPIAVKEALRSVPTRGLHWGLLKARDLPQADIGFNYLGRFEQSDGPFAFADESTGESQSGDPVHALQINAAVINGCLSLTWRYSPGLIDVDAMVDRFAGELEALVAQSLTAMPQPTASDYPLAGLTQAQFEALNLGNVQDIYPATSLQQGLLYHSLLNPHDGVYVNQLRLTLKGPVDTAALKAAWSDAVARHDILRTSFEWRHGGEVLQVVRTAVELSWVEPDDDIAAWCEADIARGFDLSHAPLLRLALFRGPEGTCDLIITNHHAITDGWSSAQLLAEVARSYRGSVVSAPAPYRAYVAWARRQPSGEAWWRGQADDAAGLTASLGRPIAVAPGTHRLEQRLPELGERLRLAARRRAVTLNTLMQGAWALVLARHAGRARVGFGITVSGRPAALAGVERMQGPFINSLPLWVDLPAAQPVDGWLQDLQARNAAMRQYEHVSLGDLQRWTGRSGDALFDSLLVFENYPVDEAIDTARNLLGVTGVESRYRTHYPLSVVIEPAQGLAIRWTWDGTRLDRAMVESLSRHYLAALERLALADDPALGSIALDAPAAAMATPCAFQPVIARIAAVPAMAVAVTADGAALSYGDLGAWSNRIGRRLKRLGVGPETRVGLCLQRSAGLVAAVIGVLKAGGAYVPLDPGYPADRLAATADDAGLRVMVTDRATLAALPGLFDDLAVVLVEDVGDESTDGWDEDVRPDQLAYVIYTSGSTGRPKGVGVTHGNLARLLTAIEAWFRFGAGDVWTLFHSYAFDFSVWEIFGCLCHGGRLVVVPSGVARDPDAFHALLQREGVTVLNQTPSAFLPLLQGDLADSLRLVIFGGEKLEPASLHRWLEQRGATAPRLVNMYGITETTVHVTARPIAPADTGGDAPRSVIGTAIPDLTLHLLDVHGNPVPVGGVGELHVGGAGLARGYLGRPGLTAERFVPDPFGPPGARLYRSGDLGRRLADGDVDYLGRNDAQVKIRGHRIELGEIQAALAAHPAVRETAVLVAHDETGGQRLIAYVVADGIGPDDLRRHLGRRLPGYMLPAGFVFLDALPLTVNGKLDRQALPAHSAEEAYEPPQTPTETTICGVLAELLGRERVGRTDDFFALGGHSLLAVRAAARLSDAVGRKVELRLLFDHPAVARLAAAIDGDAVSDGDAAALMNDWLDTLAG
ncbi:MAG: amino acid adenylation domain-containing protein, partial [Ferrovibrionaceae bacterium]